MLDSVIERWSGPLLIAAGVVAIAYGTFELITLPEPTPLREALKIIVGAPDPGAIPRIILLSGVAALLLGSTLVRHFRRERSRSVRSA